MGGKAPTEGKPDALMSPTSARTGRAASQIRDPEFLRVVGNIHRGSGAGGLNSESLDLSSSVGFSVVERILLVFVLLIAVGACALFLARPASGASTRGDCQPIHYVVNPDYAPADAVNDIAPALARVSQASGLQFVYDGMTSERPSAQRSTLPVLIAWADPQVFAGLEDQDQVAGWTHTEWVTTAAGSHLRSAWVYLNAVQDRRSGFADRQRWGGVLLHEFGHLAGAEHSTDPSQVMYPTLLPGPAEWGAQDLIALRIIGERTGCLHAPEEPA